MPAERVPTEIKLHQKSRVMEIAFSDGAGFRLSYEYLRVYELGQNQDRLWREYLDELSTAGGSRDK
jgi:DUF971 family protein